MHPVVDFPVYAVTPSETGWFVCGGGGSSKTGVVNCIVHFEMLSLAEYDTTMRYPTPKDKGAVMNLSLHGKSLVCGIDDHCYMYEVQETDLKEISSTKTDFLVAKDKYSEAYQKVVVHDQDGKLILVGGTDGVPKLMSQDLKVLHKFEGWHKSDINDASFGYIQDGDGKVTEMLPVMLTCSKEVVCLWDIEDHSMKFKIDDGGFKFARLVEMDGSLLIVLARLDSKRHSYIRIIDVKSQQVIREAKVCNKPVTAFDLIKHKEYFVVACGTSDGEVLIVDLKTLKVRWRDAKAHGFSVTAIRFGEFEKFRDIDGSQGKLMLCSASVDCTIKMYAVSEIMAIKNPYNTVLLAVLAFLVMLLAIWLSTQET